VHRPRQERSATGRGLSGGGPAATAAHAAGRDPAIGGLDPTLALRRGRFDPLALWLVWLLRRAFLPLLWIGMIGAVIGDRFDELDPQRFQTVGELFGSLLSPPAGIVLAIAARAVAAALGWVLAYPLAHAGRPADSRRRFHVPQVAVWVDRFHLTRALRAWRWTSAVRAAAAARLGDAGGRLWALDRGLLIANPVLFVGLVVTLIASGSAVDGPEAAAAAAAAPLAWRAPRTKERSRR
jgi:hypothetical protein